MNARIPERRCFRCGQTLTIEGRVGRKELCPQCGADLHVCKNCRFYEPGAYNDCRETQAERVLDKEKANFCEFFSFGTGAVGERETKPDARAKWEALFRRDP